MFCSKNKILIRNTNTGPLKKQLITRMMMMNKTNVLLKVGSCGETTQKHSY